MNKSNEGHWFRYKRIGGFPKPVSWQGLLCYGILVSILLLFCNPFFFIIDNPGFILIISISSMVIFAIVTMIKSNFIEIATRYR